jgi:hypothetical protein
MDYSTPDIVYASDREGLATNLRDKDGYIIMPEAVLKSVGPYGARLMGSLMQERRPSQPNDFREVERIATVAFLPVSTTRKLLKRLERAGWLKYIGRQPAREGAICRRTATWRITQKAWERRKPWFPWPKWLGQPRYSAGCNRLPPAAHAIYGVIMGRWCLMERKEDDGEGNLDGRQCMTVADMRKVTGLSYNSVRAAIWSLRALIEDRGDYFDLKAQRSRDK